MKLNIDTTQIYNANIDANENLIYQFNLRHASRAGFGHSASLRGLAAVTVA